MSPLCHGRPCAGHPRLAVLEVAKSWMAGPSPAMTQWQLTPRHAHMPRHRRFVVAAVDDEVMPLRLAGNRLADRILKLIVRNAGTQQRPEIGRILLSETHI